MRGGAGVGEGWWGRPAGLLQSPSLILLHPPVGDASTSATVGIAMGAALGVGDGWGMVGRWLEDGWRMAGEWLGGKA